MPRTSKKLAVVSKLKRQTAAQKKMIKSLRDKNRAKRMISKGMLLPSPGMTTRSTTPRKRRVASPKAVTISVKAGGRKSAIISVLPSCSKAGSVLKRKGTGKKPANKAASRAGRVLATAPCNKGTKRATASVAPKRKVTTAKRKTTTKSSGNIVSKIIKAVLGGGKKSASSAIKLPKVGVKKAVTKKTTAKKTTAKRVVRRASSGKLAQIKRIVC